MQAISCTQAGRLEQDGYDFGGVHIDRTEIADDGEKEHAYSRCEGCRETDRFSWSWSLRIRVLNKVYGGPQVSSAVPDDQPWIARCTPTIEAVAAQISV